MIKKSLKSNTSKSHTWAPLMLFIRAASITYASGRGLGPGNIEFFGPLMALAYRLDVISQDPKNFRIHERKIMSRWPWITRRKTLKTVVWIRPRIRSLDRKSRNQNFRKPFLCYVLPSHYRILWNSECMQVCINAFVADGCVASFWEERVFSFHI